MEKDKRKNSPTRTRDLHGRTLLSLMIGSGLLGLAVLIVPPIYIMLIPPLTQFTGVLLFIVQILWLPLYLRWQHEFKNSRWRRRFNPLIMLILFGMALMVGSYLQALYEAYPCFSDAGFYCVISHKGLLDFSLVHYEPIPFTPFMRLLF